MTVNITEAELVNKSAKYLSRFFIIELEVWSDDHKSRIDMIIIHKSDIQLTISHMSCYTNNQGYIQSAGCQTHHSHRAGCAGQTP